MQNSSSITAKTRQPFYIPAYLTFFILAWLYLASLTSHQAKPTNKERAGFYCHFQSLLFMFCPWLVVNVDVCFWTVFQWTDYQHILLVIMENEKDLIKGRGYALRQWKEEGIVVYFFLPHFPAPRSRCLSVSSFIPIIPFHYPLGTIFSFSIILIRTPKNSTWLNDNDGMAKTNRIQAACAFSSDMMSSVIPSFPRFSIRGLYLCLFLSCLVIPNNSRKSNVTSFLYSFP